MLKLGCRIRIWREREVDGVVTGTEWVIRSVESIEITGDGNTLADTCTIRLPKATQWIEGEIPVRRGDNVEVWLGYNENLKPRFIGYVKDVSAKTPTVITCEDEMMKLRQKQAKRKVYANVTLTELLQDQFSGLSVAWKNDIIGSQEVRLGLVKVEATTVAGLLQDLKQNFGVKSGFLLDEYGQPKFYAYVIYPEQRRLAGRFEEGQNIISNSLEYRRAEDVQVKVRGISIQEDNSRIEYVEGEGEERTIYRYGLTMEELKEAVRVELRREKWSGLSGNFETFGEPRVEKLDAVDLVVGNAKGRYQVEGVNVKFGSGGYRQAIEVRRKLSDI